MVSEHYILIRYPTDLFILLTFTTVFAHCAKCIQHEIYEARFLQVDEIPFSH